MAKVSLLKKKVKVYRGSNLFGSSARKSEGVLSRLSRSTSPIKRQSKKTLKAVLLSKTFHKSFRFAVIAFIALGTLYGAYALLDNNVTANVIVSESEIIKRVSKLTDLPKEAPLSVARVEDAVDLQKQNAFYSNVKEGDYILAYKNTIVIYDLLNDVIVSRK